MASVQRAFAQKLSKQHAADVRKQIATSYSQDLAKSTTNISGFSSSASLYDIVDPLDYEEFIQQHRMLLDHDALHHVLDFPENDIVVRIIPRKIRTLLPVVPQESLNVLPPHVQDCVRCYTSDWVVISYQYRHHSSSNWVRDHIEEKHSLVKTIPRQEFEVDYDEPLLADSSMDISVFKSEQSINSIDMPRGSWASFDLRNSMSDQLILTLLEQVPPETMDQLNEASRQDQRQAPQKFKNGRRYIKTKRNKLSQAMKRFKAAQQSSQQNGYGSEKMEVVTPSTSTENVQEVREESK